MLHLINYVPIDKKKVKKHWDKIMNIPNDQWNILEIEKNIDIINDTSYPTTLRTVKLNLLPYLVIEAIDNDIMLMKKSNVKQF